MAKIDPKLVQQTTQLKTTKTTKTTAAKEVKADEVALKNDVITKFMQSGDLKTFLNEAKKVGISDKEISLYQNKRDLQSNTEALKELGNLKNSLLAGDIKKEDFVNKAKAIGVDDNLVKSFVELKDLQTEANKLMNDSKIPLEQRRIAQSFMQKANPTLDDVKSLLSEVASLKTTDKKTAASINKVTATISEVVSALEKGDDTLAEAILGDLKDDLGGGNEGDGNACYMTGAGVTLSWALRISGWIVTPICPIAGIALQVAAAAVTVADSLGAFGGPHVEVGPLQQGWCIPADCRQIGGTNTFNCNLGN